MKGQTKKGWGEYSDPIYVTTGTSYGEYKVNSIYKRAASGSIYVGFTLQDIDNYDNVEMPSLH